MSRPLPADSFGATGLELKVEQYERRCSGK